MSLQHSASLKLNKKSDRVSCLAEDNVNQQQEMPILLAKDVSKGIKTQGFSTATVYLITQKVLAQRLFY